MITAFTKDQRGLCVQQSPTSPNHQNPNQTIAHNPTNTNPPPFTTTNFLDTGDWTPQHAALGQNRHFQPGSFHPPISPSGQQKEAARGRQKTKGDTRSNNIGRRQATRPTPQPTPITNELCHCLQQHSANLLQPGDCHTRRFKGAS